MNKIERQLKAVFKELDEKIAETNLERKDDGLPSFPKAEIKLLGQLSLLLQEKVSAVLSLAATGDMDALLTMDSAIKNILKELLRKEGFLYDEDSYLIWIPEKAAFDTLFEFKNVTIKVIDPESALVSKAVKAPEKNKQLIRQAIASGMFPNLINRIESGGGNLEFFGEDE